MATLWGTPSPCPPSCTNIFLATPFDKFKAWDLKKKKWSKSENMLLTGAVLHSKLAVSSYVFTWPWSSRQVGRLRWKRNLQRKLPPDVRTTLPIRAGPCLSLNFLSSSWIVLPPSSRMLLDSTFIRRSRLGCSVHTITSAWGIYYIWSKCFPRSKSMQSIVWSVNWTTIYKRWLWNKTVNLNNSIMYTGNDFFIREHTV